MKKYPIYPIERFNCNSVHEDLYINTLEQHLEHYSFVDKPHRHNSFVLVFFTEGSGTHEIDFDVFNVQPGSLFFLQAGQVHHWSLSGVVTGFVVFYTQEMFNLYFGQKNITMYSFYSSLNTIPELILDSKGIKTVLPYFESLILENHWQQQYKQDKIMNLLDCIHIEIARNYHVSKRHEVHSYNAKIKAFEILLEQNFKTDKAPLNYASNLAITLKHLNRICNEILQKTTTDVITDRVMLEAKRMLLDKEFTINEIALRLGYSDFSYFSRLFKKKTGLTPTHFRTTKN